MSNSQQYIVGLVIYPGMTALDIVGPQTVLSSLSDIQIHRIWKVLEPIQTDDGMMIVPDTTFADCPPLDVICVGGGLEQMAVVDDPEVLEFLKQQGSTAKFITSVCGGSVFLAKQDCCKVIAPRRIGQSGKNSSSWALRSEPSES